MNVQLTVLLLYSASFIAFGAFVSRRVVKADDFLVAGRRLGPGLLGATFLAANIGAGSTVGATGLGYRYGLGAWWWVGCAGIGSLILAHTVGPRIWALASEHRWRTVGDFLDHRYNRSVRALIAALLWAGALMILAAQLLAISQILTAVIDVPKWEGCLIGGVVVAAYFSVGGLLSSARVNVIQLTVKLAGFALAVPFAIHAVGGVASLQTALQHTKPIGAPGILTWMAVIIPSFVISPGLIQKLYAGRDERAVRTGVSWNAVGLLLFAFVPAILGAIAHARFPALADSEQALPMLMTRVLPPWLGLLTLASVFSAELSASDAVLFMLSSSLTVDLYKTFLRPKAPDADLLFVGRVVAVVGAVVAVLLAIALPSIIAGLQIFYTLMAVAITAPLVVGLYSSGPTARRALIAIVSAVIVTGVTQAAGLALAAPSGLAMGFVIMLLP